VKENGRKRRIGISEEVRDGNVIPLSCQPDILHYECVL
jgi:hypothetical protein